MTSLTTTTWTNAYEDPRRERPKAPVPEPDPVLRTEEENAVAWLVVLGTGSWGYANAARHHRDYKAGIHRVCQETVDFALRAKSPRLVVTQDEPIVDRRHLPGPLSLAHLRLPSDNSVRLQPLASDAALSETSDRIPYSYPCGRCPASFPSAGARDRHVEMNHEGR